MEKNGLLNKLIEAFRNNKCNNGLIKDYLALLIGTLFKATLLPTEFGSEIVE
jgi:hypothetical protein